MQQNKTHLAAQKICMLVVGKKASTLSTSHGIVNCVKYLQPISASCSLHCRPHLLSVKSENLVHSTFRNENSTLEIKEEHLRTTASDHYALFLVPCMHKFHDKTIYEVDNDVSLF